MSEYNYTYPVDELDKIIEEMMNGIQPMIDDVMQTEVQLRWKERQNEMFGTEDEEEVDEELVKKHADIMKKKIADDRKKASRNDVIILKISDEKKAEIRKQMSVSIVRPNPNDQYNIPNDQLYQNKSREAIYAKLRGLKNCYYNQQDYVNAINIIKDAIELSLREDYPWMTYEEAVREFNAGRIKFKWCNIPKLYINHATQITDKELLKGVVTGDIILRDRSEDNDKPRVKRKKGEPISVDYNVIGSDMYNQMVAAHNAGYDTPASAIIRQKNSVYNPTAIPFGNSFGSVKQNKNNEPVLWDWTKEGAGEAYFNHTKGHPTGPADIIRYVDSANDGMLNSVMTRNAQEFLRSMKNNSQQTGGYDYTLPNFMQQPNPSNTTYNEEAAAVERDLLASITMNNPK